MRAPPAASDSSHPPPSLPATHAPESTLPSSAPCSAPSSPSSSAVPFLAATTASSLSPRPSRSPSPLPVLELHNDSPSETECALFPSPLDILESLLNLCECGHSDFSTSPRSVTPADSAPRSDTLAGRSAPSPGARLASTPVELPEFPLRVPSRRWRGYRTTVWRHATLPRSLSSPVRNAPGGQDQQSAMHAPGLSEETAAYDAGALCCCAPPPQGSLSVARMALVPPTRSYYYARPAPVLSPSVAGYAAVSGGSRVYAAGSPAGGAAPESFHRVVNGEPEAMYLTSPSAVAYAPGSHEPRHLTVPTLPPAAGTGEDWGESRRRLPVGAPPMERDAFVTEALLRKEAELQANARRLVEGTAGFEEVRQLRGDLCEKEMEVEQLKAEVHLARKEKGDLNADLLMKDAVISALKAGDDSDLPDVRTVDAVKTLREKEEENRLLSRRLEAMREERRDMRELLLQKDKQLAAAMSVSDTEAKEASAVQLGVQAIAMVQDSVELREKMKRLDAELAALKEEKGRRELLLEETFRKLTDKRKEAAGLLEMVSQRDMKLARVETFLQQRNRDYDQLQEESRAALRAEAARVEKSEEEIKILQEQQGALKNIVASRDEKVTCLQNEVVRRDALIKQLEQRLKVLSQDLEQSAGHLQQLLRASAAKDAYLFELESQLRRNEVERQASYLAEVSRTRRLALETRLKEEECRAALNDKEEALASAQHELSRNSLTLQQLRHAFATVEATDACYRPVESRAASPSAARDKAKDRESGTTSLPVSTTEDALYRIPTATSVPQRPLQESLRLLEADAVVHPRPAGTAGLNGLLRQPRKGDTSTVYTYYEASPQEKASVASTLALPAGFAPTPHTFPATQAYAGILRANTVPSGDVGVSRQGGRGSPTAYATLPASRVVKQVASKKAEESAQKQ
ncbi:putative high molecular mass nuclear antigen [Neospora caninum Liverpool]|uniref:Putative high molecular mass nuclear antigen n=1 Tax=Neospora caninum (strain Liverpool) TaxID=572307 RepID=F0VHU1_NEOCL|nr:putative high molecular mass nuclear antigen [Neospora caninum Liverpool]CBZ53302.1 putative high molecular mass nuclear antigen [Neospora caninum Liverpool]|eukprot:XP_003883334.1 putative high molecular mass nuclear antigen [Neospora caninum Liverpool]